MDILTTARRLESKIARTLDRAAHRAMGSPERDPLAVIHAVVERVEQELQPAGRGRRVFPYNSVTVTLLAASAATRARYEALLDCGPSLRQRLADALRTKGTETSDLDVKVAYAEEPATNWIAADFHVELARVTAPVVAVVASEPRLPDSLELTIVHGAAEQPTYGLAQARVDLGRGREVRDTRNHLLRTNHVVFTEGAGEANRSVSRQHAHVTWDPESSEYRIHDDGSAHGTHVLRNGAAIAVRTGSRGVRLRDGDEVVLGEARVRVTLRSR